jgi:hypothetical protein
MGLLACIIHKKEKLFSGVKNASSYTIKLFLNVQLEKFKNQQYGKK